MQLEIGVGQAGMHSPQWHRTEKGMTDVSSPNLFFIALEYVMPCKMTSGDCELWILCVLNYKLRNTNRQTHHCPHAQVRVHTNTCAHNSPDTSITVVCALKQVISSVLLLSAKLR